MVHVRPAAVAPSSPPGHAPSPSCSAARRVAGLLTGQTRASYSRAKLLDYAAYARSTPRWRCALVVLGTPVPALLAVLLPPLLPLRDPTLGILENPGFCVHFVVVMALTVLGALVQGRTVTGLPHHQYTTLQAVAVSFLASSHLLGVTIALALAWRFPVPFTWATDFAPWVLCVVWANLLVFRSRLVFGELTRPVLAFLPSFVIQISQIILYPALSAAFGFVNESQQVLLTLAFPVVKYVMKKLLRVGSRALGEYSEEVAVSGVEICAAMYQSQIMQNTSSYMATAVIMGVDMVQGIASVKIFMDKTNDVVRRAEIVDTAILLLESKQKKQIRAHDPTQVVVPARPCAAQVVPEPGSEGDHHENKHDAIVINHALEILHSAESILLVEYFEVAIPVVNGVFLAIAGQMDSARYNPNLRPFYQNPDRLNSAMASLLVYSLLQGLSVVLINLVMWHRYKISGLTHLAYVLEHHSWSLQGKLISWLAVFFNFTVVHYGTDFTFKIDFSMPTTL